MKSLMHQSCDFEGDAVLDRQPVKVSQSCYDAGSAVRTEHETGGVYINADLYCIMFVR